MSRYFESNSGCVTLKNTIQSKAKQSKAKQLQKIGEDILKFITACNRYPHVLTTVRPICLSVSELWNDAELAEDHLFLFSSSSTVLPQSQTYWKGLQVFNISWYSRTLFFSHSLLWKRLRGLSIINAYTSWESTQWKASRQRNQPFHSNVAEVSKQWDYSHR